MGDTEIDSERHHKMVQRFKADHPCFDLFELTGRGSFDIQLKDFAPLEERPHRLPLVPTLLEIITARRASKMWDALSSAEESSHPPAIQKLFTDLVCDLSGMPSQGAILTPKQVSPGPPGTEEVNRPLNLNSTYTILVVCS